MSAGLRKCLSMGLGCLTPGHTQNLSFRSGRAEYGGPNYDVFYSDNTFFLGDTRSRWVRLMVHLPTFWPTANSINGTLLAELDFQLALARAYSGCKTIVTIGEDMPAWINGSSNPKQRPPHSSMTGSGPWARMIDFFAARYNLNNPNRPHNGASTIDVLEVFNEPNQHWGPAGANGDGHLDVAHCVATGMLRAKQLAAFYGGAPIMGGPSVLDFDRATEPHRNYWEFTDNVLWYLSGNGFYNVLRPDGSSADPYVVWTMHNYADVVNDHGSNTTAPDRATYFPTDPNRKRSVMRSRRIRDILGTGGSSARPWRGWPWGDTQADIFITEGGGELSRVAARWGSPTYADAKYKQAVLTSRNVNRLGTNTEGGGIGLVTNYLAYSDHRTDANGDPVFGDSGLLDDVDDHPDQGAAKRIVYDTWKSYPGYQ